VHEMGVQQVRRMTLSAIIPVYNVAPYLARCLDSVLAAVDALEFRNDAEVICIDDGSTDGSSAILREYADRDARIKVVRQENQGLSAARNAGLDIASGEWIAFIDSDDWVEKDYFTALFGAVRRTGASIAAVNSADCDAASYWCKRGSSPAVAWGKLYKAALWKTLRFPVGRLHEDEFTTHKAVFESVRIAGVRKMLYRYTVRRDSIMRDKSEKALTDWLEGCAEQAAYVRTYSERAYGEALAKKIQVVHWMGSVRRDDVAEYARVMRGRVGKYYWPEHYRHPWLVNRLTWQIIKLCCFL